MPKKPQDKLFNGITIEVGGEIVGKIKEWTTKPLEESANWPAKYTKFLEEGVPSSGQDPNMHQISFPVGSLPELWGPPCVFSVSGKSTLGLTALGKLLEPGYLYIRSQLEMWGMNKAGQVCPDCWAEIVQTLKDMGYEVWFDQKPGIDKELAESCGVVIRDYKLNYVGAGEKDEPK